MRGTKANQIFLRPFDRLDEPQPLEGSQGANWPVFSPDGKWMAFYAGGKLKKLPISGGTPVTLCDAPECMSASWSNSGHIVIAQRKSGLMRVPAEGGAPELVTTVDVAAGELDHHSPRFLPGDKALLFGIHAGPEVFRIAVRSLATGEQKTLVDDGFDGVRSEVYVRPFRRDSRRFRQTAGPSRDGHAMGASCFIGADHPWSLYQFDPYPS